jgi:hypothetical protein
MRVLLHQSAKGLFSPSGGYKSNLTVLRYLASQGHTVEQVGCVHSTDISEYIADMKSTGFETSIRKYQLQIPSTSKPAQMINVSQFTMHDGVRVVALDAADVESVFPISDFRKFTRAFVEVRTIDPSSIR